MAKRKKNESQKMVREITDEKFSHIFFIDPCGARFKKIRDSLNLTQEQMKEKLFIGGGSLSEIENDKYKPNYYLLHSLVRVFNVNLYYLMFGEGEMFSKEPEFRFKYREDSVISKEPIKQLLYYLENSNTVQLKIMQSFLRIYEDEKQMISVEMGKPENKEQEMEISIIPK